MTKNDAYADNWVIHPMPRRHVGLTLCKITVGLQNRLLDLHILISNAVLRGSFNCSIAKLVVTNKSRLLLLFLSHV